MNRRILKRLLVLSLVSMFSIFWIASHGLRLGLDLKGGVQVSLRVITDDAIKAETDKADNTRSEPITPAREKEIRENATVTTMRIIQNRLDEMGIEETTIQRMAPATDYAIQVQVPGTQDPNRVKQVIQATAILELKLVERGPFESAQAAAAAFGGTLPPEFQILRHDTEHYVLRRAAAVSGVDLKNASAARDNFGRPQVTFALTVDATQRFSEFTERHVGRGLAIVLDGVIQSVPLIEGRIEGDGVIQGGSKGFTQEETRDLALVLRAGALPARVEYMSEELVGPTLGADSIKAGIVASAVAMGAVTVFMVGYYRMAGVNAAATMLLNLLILLGMMAALGAALTLPGIAGVVLTIGMGIDSNVLIFERIREELGLGKTPAAAIATGFQRVLRTLIDTHLAALISAAILFMFGSGAVRGFAVTLAMGLLSNLFTSVYASRTLFDWSLWRRGARISI
jgi:preprotein translocase subunit SecD